MLDEALQGQSPVLPSVWGSETGIHDLEHMMLRHIVYPFIVFSSVLIVNKL